MLSLQTQDSPTEKTAICSDLTAVKTAFMLDQAGDLQCGFYVCARFFRHQKRPPGTGVSLPRPEADPRPGP